MRFVVNLLAVACSAFALWAATPAARAQTPQEDCAFAHNPDDAIRACNEVIGRNPRDATAYSNRDVAYAQKGDLDTAIRDLDQAIGINPRATATRATACCSRTAATRTCTRPTTTSPSGTSTRP